MPQKLRIGIIGANAAYGWGMRAHMPALQGMREQFEVVAVCATRPESAQAAAAHYGIPLAFHEPAALAAHPDVDLVDICVRVPFHHQLALAAVRARKHIYCEWPLGANLGEAMEMRAQAQAAGVSTAIGLQARGAPVFNYVRDLVAQGYIGQPVSCLMFTHSSGALNRGASFAWAADPAKGATGLSIQAGHALDALTYCLGDFRELSAVVATQTKEALVPETGQEIKMESPDHVVVNGMLANGTLVAFSSSSIPFHGSGFAFHIYGTKGTLSLDSGGSAQYGEHVLRGARGPDKSLEPLPVPPSYTWVPDSVPKGAPFNVAQLLQRHGESIRSGVPLANDFNVGVRLHRLLDTIKKASDSGQRQTL